jgi:hypothetical protein
MSLAFLIYVVIGIPVATWSIRKFFPDNETFVDVFARVVLFFMITFMWPIWLVALGFGAAASYLVERNH